MKIMELINKSHPEEFILLGFADHPWLQLPLFIILLITYPMAMMGNIAIILVSKLDPRLHSPMYFFLTNLSFLDMCYTTSIVPQMLFNLGTSKKTISYMGCAVQLYFFHMMAGAESLLLAVMSFDRYVAICKPLHYTLIMKRRICILLVATVWLSGMTYAVSEATITLQLPLYFCGPCEIDHFFCDLPPILALACGDTSHSEAAVFVAAILCISSPFLLIIASYGRILAAVLIMPSPEGRQKALSTCSSHLLVVTLFYGSGSVTYLRPKASHSPGVDKLLALFYTVVTSMLNPVIYSLRNKEVKTALRRTLGKKSNLI
ncbi:unnamed protein product [Rangifer tarandus platyrhynchus]|uniref:Uncharacterized protein n=2 Tax=Rangifer tarandus platyrhynchus TaxID=3082113 RepID=A0AC59ZEA9_RANTA|nr:unnamed protein product [Rangifer tarandus platyrhynchus]